MIYDVQLRCLEAIGGPHHEEALAPLRDMAEEASRIGSDAAWSIRLAGLDNHVVAAGGVVEVDDPGDAERRVF
jgi:hypothetical protein